MATWATAESAAQKQLVQSTTDLTVALDALATVEETAGIRAAGDAATAAAAQTADFVEMLPAGDQQSGLSDVSKALSAIAGLNEVSGEEPDAWDDAEEPIRALSEADDATVSELGVLADAAANRVDSVLDEATDAYDEWAAANADATAERDAAIAGATSYTDQMNSYLDDYGSLRSGLSAFIQLVDTQGSTIEEAYRQLAEASQARRDLRDRMTSLTPPAQAANEHGRLLAIMADGIAGVEAAERGLDQRECTYYGCIVSEQPAWQQFLSESKRISAALGEASGAWQTAATAAIDEARASKLPEKPQF